MTDLTPACYNPVVPAAPVRYWKAEMESPLAHQRIDQAPRYQATDAVSVLRRGGVVAVPTDTLYGLAVSALDVAAVERLFRIKGRPESRAMPLLLADAADIDRYAAEVPQVAWALAEAFFPGALTLVLRRGDVVPEAVTGGLDTVAVRVPDHPVPRTIVRELGAPITGTSANRTGSSAPNDSGGGA